MYPSPPCIRTALAAPCPKCGFWLCQKHMPVHDCKKLETWQTNAPALNALKPFQVDYNPKKGKVNIHSSFFEEIPIGDMEKPKRKSPSRKDWRKIIPK